VALASAELYDRQSGVWVPTGPLTDLRSEHTATPLPSTGQILIAGGNYGPPNVTAPILLSNSADLYDRWTNSHRATQVLVRPRAGHTATLLDEQSVACADPTETGPCSRVLVAGGINGMDQTGLGGTSEIYTYDADPPLEPDSDLYWSDTDDYWTAVSDPLDDERAYHTATLLSNGGQVLVAGGADPTAPAGCCSSALASSELFTP
jgi:hypothetical protein